MKYPERLELIKKIKKEFQTPDDIISGHQLPKFDYHFKELLPYYLNKLREDPSYDHSFDFMDTEESTFFEYSSNCSYCGEYISYLEYNSRLNTLRPINHKLVQIGCCQYKDKKIVVDIDIEDDLVFSNIILKNNKYIHEVGSLNNRTESELAKKYAHDGILYAQTGNMTCYLYKKETDIIILSMNIDDINQEELEEYQKETQLSFKKYKEMNLKFMGVVYCEVWRWMATSEKNLEKIQGSFFEPESRGEVKIKMTSGKYTMRNYYQIDSADILVSTIKLKSE